MTLVVPENYAQVIHSLRLTGDSGAMAITYGVAVVEGATASDVAEDCAAAVAPILEYMSTQYSMVSTEAILQDEAPPAAPAIGVAAVTIAGGDPGSVIPQNSAYLLHKRTGRAGRTGRGRLYLPGITQDRVNDVGALTTSTVSGLTTAGADFLSNLFDTASVLGMVLFHDSTGSAAAVAPTPVTSLVCDPTISTQRRRLR